MSLFHTLPLLLASLRARPQFYLEIRSRKQVRDDGQVGLRDDGQAGLRNDGQAGLRDDGQAGLRDDGRSDKKQTATLHTLERRTHCYAVTNTHTTDFDSLVALSSFLDRIIPVKKRRPFSVVVHTTRTTSLIAVLHRLGLSPYGVTDTPLFMHGARESIARVENTAQRDSLVPTLIYTAAGILCTSFLLCSSLAAWSVWHETKQQDFLLTQQEKLASHAALPTPPKVVKREKVAQLLEGLSSVILACPGSRGNHGLSTSLRLSATTGTASESDIVLHSLTIQNGTTKKVLRSHDKKALDNPTLVPGCHPPLWQVQSIC